MNLRHGRFAGLLLVLIPGCPSDEGGGAAETEQPGSGSGSEGTETGSSESGSDSSGEAGTDSECPFECSGNGQCVLVDGLPACDCDPGFEEQGLDCLDPTDPAAPPGDFTCPAPGDVSSADADRLVSQGWAYVSNDTACERYSTSIYRFRADGIFTRHHQGSGATEAGTLVYGCWTLESETDGVLGLLWSPAEESNSSLNCGDIAGLADPPDCEGSLLFDAAREGLVIQESLAFGEVHVLHSAPETCVWCSDDAGCCPDVSWVEADGEPLCD